VASVAENAGRVVRRIGERAEHRGGRLIVAIAGPPGGGKSTLADAVARGLNTEGERAAVFPMDGYHYDDAILNARGDRARKGAPHTYDVDGFAAMLKRLRDEPTRDAAVPVFDRDLELSRGSARIIAPHHSIIVCEGNYLLLDDAPWTGLAPLFDLTVMIVESEAELLRRLTARWVHYGFDAAAMANKLDGNDMPNVRLVLARSRAADITLAG
jgi:pantothenate kinase